MHCAAMANQGSSPDHGNISPAYTPMYERKKYENYDWVDDLEYASFHHSANSAGSSSSSSAKRSAPIVLDEDENEEIFADLPENLPMIKKKKVESSDEEYDEGSDLEEENEAGASSSSSGHSLKKGAIFLSRTAKSGNKCALICSLLHKAFRRNLQDDIGLTLVDLVELPKGLAGRMAHIALEDAPFGTAAILLCDSKRPIEAQMETFRRLAMGPKCHSTAWLARCATEVLHREGDAFFTRFGGNRMPWIAQAHHAAKCNPTEDAIIILAAVVLHDFLVKEIDLICKHFNTLPNLRHMIAFLGKERAPLLLMAIVLWDFYPELVGDHIDSKKVLEPLPKPGTKYFIPDWAYDKHTPEGRRMGRKMAHFLEEGLEVQNRLFGDKSEPFEVKARETYTRTNMRSRDIIKIHTEKHCPKKVARKGKAPAK